MTQILQNFTKLQFQTIGAFIFIYFIYIYLYGGMICLSLLRGTICLGSGRGINTRTNLKVDLLSIRMLSVSYFIARDF